jgi:hypothetical protein
MTLKEYERVRFIRKLILLILMSLLMLVTGCSYNGETGVSPERNEKVSIINLSEYFIGYDGCIVLFDKNKNEYTIYNES